MADIVERLRGPAPLHWEAKEAADIITALRAEVEDLGNRLHHVHRLWANNEHALRAENEKLRAALLAFAKHFGPIEDNIMLHEGARECFRLARAALEEKP